MVMRRKGRTVGNRRPVYGLIIVLLLLAACVPITAPTPIPPEEPVTVSEPATPTPEPAVEPPAESPPETVDMDAIFPPGAEHERTLVLFSCGSCHSWVCSVMGQRPVEHWRTTQATHRDLVSALSDEEYQLLFDFLAEHFNDTKPEPPLPAALRELGCTTQ